ncbi:hypothetical protein [Tomitella cavernea]|uniref:hypothetical protein n=1 Tax=Tomitella cavernea TaxID=1387982 RepID=UPI0031EF5289
MDTAAAADDWWHSLPPDRRVQIWRWVDRPAASAETPGQMSIPIRSSRRRRDRTS